MLRRLLLAAVLAFAPLAQATIQYIPGGAGQLVMFGLSSDTKPTIANGHVFIETDTSKMFVRTAGVWVESTNVAYQPLDSDLTAIAALTTTAHGRGLLDDADAAASRASLSLGTAATSASTDFGPSGVDYLVGTANGTLTGEIAVGTSPGGELGGTWASPTLDDGITVDTWTLGSATVGSTASANDNDTSLATTAYVQGEIDDVDNLSDNCAVENDSTPIPDTCVGNGADDGAATNIDYLVGTATAGLSAEIAVGTSPGGELGGTWASPTLDDSVAVTSWNLTTPVVTTDITIPNTGLHVLDTNASHDLIIAPGSDLTVDRQLTITTGDSARTLTISGNADISGTTSGTNTGDQTSVTGNAGTVTFADAGGDTTTNVALGTAATGSLAPATDAGLTYNATTDVLTATVAAGSSSTGSTAAANDNDTSIATTAFVQQEIDDGDLLSDNCVLENDATPIPDSCVGDGSDAGGGGGGITYADAVAASLAGF